MIDLLTKEICACEIALQQPNKSIDNYRCYWEGRLQLAKELLPIAKKNSCTCILNKSGLIIDKCLNH